MSERQSREGSRVPDVTLCRMKESNVERLPAGDLFKGRRVVVFALPGAFTPTCSTAHVPGYSSRLKDFREAGIWQQSEKAEGLLFAADPFGDFTREMGMAVEHRDVPLGTRSWRYSMLVEDCVITKMFIEPDKPGDPFEVSDADTMLNYVRPNHQTVGPAFMLARHGCPHCARAKKLLEDRGITYEAVHLGDELTMQGVQAAAGRATVPQVFLDGKLIGGADELEKYLAARA